MQKKRKNDEDNGFGEWGGYMDAKITKLEEQFICDAKKNPFKKSNLFAGISIYVNGLTNPTAEELKRIMMIHGGIYHAYKRSTTTFIIAANLPDVKIRQNASTNRCYIIRPDWIVDCLKEKKILDYSKYLLHTIRLTNQPKIVFKNIDSTDSNLTAVNNSISSSINQKSDHFYDHTINDAQNQDDFGDATTNDGINEDLAILNQKLCETSIFNNLMSLESKPKSEIESTKNYATTKTACDPNFLEEFYKNSRLHHISTLGANFKYLITELRASHNGTFPDRQILIDKYKESKNDNEDDNDKSIKIMHIDMDCFFVSVGLRNRSHLYGKPIAVTHSKGSAAGPIQSNNIESRKKEIELYAKRLNDKTGDTQCSADKFGANISATDSLSEIASCSYEARSLGIKNGMMVGSALKLCPNLITIPYDFDEYKEVAELLYNTIAKYTLDIEAVSCDEMYVNLTNLCECTVIPIMKIVKMIRDEIQDKTKCPCSAGIGSNRLQARMATKKAKPNGQFHLTADNVQKYFCNIQIADLPGVGPSTQYKLRQNNWITCEDLQSVALSKLRIEFGNKFAERLHDYCRGIDTKPLVYGQVRKSVSVEVNYGIRFTNNDELETFLKQLCQEVHSRLMEIKRRGKTITLKYMIRSKDAPIETAKYMGHGVCDYLTKSLSLPEFTCSLYTIIKTVLNIKNLLNISPDELRGIGIHIARLDNDCTGSSVTGDEQNVLKTMFNKVIEKNLQKSIAIHNSDTISEDNSTKTPETASSNKIEIKMNLRNGKTVSSTKTSATVNSNRGKLRGSKAKQMGRGITRNISTMLAMVKEKSSANVTAAIDNKFLTDNNIDMNVLMELPENIRKEIIREYKQPLVEVAVDKKKSNSENVSDKEYIDPEFLAALPSDIRNELIKQNRSPVKIKQNISPVKEKSIFNELESLTNLSPKKKYTPTCNSADTSFSCDSTTIQLISQDNVLVDSNWRKVLKEWIESTVEPIICDIEIIEQYAVELVVANKLNELYVVLRYLFRIIAERNICSWHLAYNRIVSRIQLDMVHNYGHSLFVKNYISCTSCVASKK